MYKTKTENIVEKYYFESGAKNYVLRCDDFVITASIRQ